MKRLAIMCVLICVVCGGNVSGEFIDNNNGTITDTETELIWQSYEAAITSPMYKLGENLNSPWRLPSYEKISKLYPYIYEKMVTGEEEFFWLVSKDGKGKNLAISFKKGEDWIHMGEALIDEAKILAVWNDNNTFPLCPTCPLSETDNNFGCFIDSLFFAKSSPVWDLIY